MPTQSGSRPSFVDLPKTTDGTPGCAWQVYGSEDQLGTVNLLTPEVVRNAAASIQTGQRYVLSLPLDEPSPPLFGRQPLEHTVMTMGEQGFDDRLDCVYPQGSTQWDALSHFGHSSGFYGGRSHDDVLAGRLGIFEIANVGLAGRGVLLDVARYEHEHGRQLDPTATFGIGPALLQAVADWEGVQFRSGDILCIRTGWVGWYMGLNSKERQAISALSENYLEFQVAGLTSEDAMAEFLWDNGFAAVAVDNPTVEVMPVSLRGTEPSSDDPLHTRVIGLLGLTLGEFFVLDPIAEACAADKRYDFFVTSAPLLIRGGVGSPPNVLAIR